MIDDERPSFGAAEVIEIASKFEAADDTFIIGGQATNFWAWFFQEKEPELKLRGPFTSQDIDFSARKRSPEAWLRRRWRATSPDLRRSYAKHRPDRYDHRR